jgi:hypothetical protein
LTQFFAFFLPAERLRCRGARLETAVTSGPFPCCLHVSKMFPFPAIDKNILSKNFAAVSNAFSREVDRRGDTLFL